MLLINGRLPFDAVNANAQIAGSYQALGTRQNGSVHFVSLLRNIYKPFMIRFFASYTLGPSTWNYLMGNFAQQGLPLDDEAVLLVQKVNSILPEIVVVSGWCQSRSGAFINPYSCPTDPGLVPSRLSRTGHLSFKTIVVPSSAPMDRTSAETLHLRLILLLAPNSGSSLLPRLHLSNLSTSCWTHPPHLTLFCLLYYSRPCHL